MRFLRNLLVAAIVTGAAYGYFKTHDKGLDVSAARDWVRGVLETAPDELASSSLLGGGSVDGPRVDDPAQLFNFDITPQWVQTQWTRVTSGLSDPRFQGYRVSVVTGSGQRDLAGALSYYFDSRQRLRRITFVGATGDAAHLVGWVTRRFGFRRLKQEEGPHTYVAGRFQRFRGVLRISPKSTFGILDSTPTYDVELIVER